MKADPDKTIDRKAIVAWRTVGGLRSLVFWIAPAVILLFALAGNLSWWIFYATLAFAVLNTTLAMFIIPPLRWKYWRYTIDEKEIDLKRGFLFITRTLIPIKRVQHVDTRQGPIFRDLGLSSVTISTAATMHEIPALNQEVAEELREVIAKYARLSADDI